MPERPKRTLVAFLRAVVKSVGRLCAPAKLDVRVALRCRRESRAVDWRGSPRDVRGRSRESSQSSIVRVRRESVTEVLFSCYSNVFRASSSAITG